VEKVVDTTGCGDSYQGAFIVDYLMNGDILSAMKAGSAIRRRNAIPCRRSLMMNIEEMSAVLMYGNIEIVPRFGYVFYKNTANTEEYVLSVGINYSF